MRELCAHCHLYSTDVFVEAPDMQVYCSLLIATCIKSPTADNVMCISEKKTMLGPVKVPPPQPTHPPTHVPILKTTLSPLAMKPLSTFGNLMAAFPIPPPTAYILAIPNYKFCVCFLYLRAVR